MARSLNKVTLIGNLTRDPELRYTGKGTPVCSFGLATNRQWNDDSGEKKESVEFHNIVAWNKLGELCSQLLVKGRKVYVEGRLQTRKWTGQDEVERTTTEIVITDMIILDSRGSSGSSGYDDIPDNLDEEMPDDDSSSNSKKSTKKSESKKKDTKKDSSNDGDDSSDDDEDIPF